MKQAGLDPLPSSEVQLPSRSSVPGLVQCTEVDPTTSSWYSFISSMFQLLSYQSGVNPHHNFFVAKNQDSKMPTCDAPDRCI